MSSAVFTKEASKHLQTFLGTVHEYCTRVLLVLTPTTLRVYAIDPYEQCDACLELPYTSKAQTAVWAIHTYLDPIRKVCTGGSLRVTLRHEDDHLLVQKTQRKEAVSLELAMERLEDLDAIYNFEDMPAKACTVIACKELSRVAHATTAFGAFARCTVDKVVTLKSSNLYGSMSYQMPVTRTKGKRARSHVGVTIPTKYLKCVYMATGKVNLNVCHKGMTVWSEEGKSMLRLRVRALCATEGGTTESHTAKRRRVATAVTAH